MRAFALRTSQTEICPNTNLPACCSFRHGLRRATVLREEGFGFPRSPTCLSLWERCRAATERAGSFFEGAGLPPCGKTEGAANYLSRIRRTLAQTCSRAAPSVTACAVPPSSERKALVFRAVQLVSPSGRDVAQRQRGQAPSLRELDCRLAARLREFYRLTDTHKICPDADLPACCPLSHLP